MQGHKLSYVPFDNFYVSSPHYRLSIDGTVLIKEGHKTGTKHQTIFKYDKKEAGTRM